MKLADLIPLPRRTPKPPAPAPVFIPVQRPPRPRQVRKQGHAPTVAQPVLRPVVQPPPPGPRKYQPPPMHVLRRVARALRESQTRQERFWRDWEDLPMFRAASKGHVRSLYTNPRPAAPIAAEGTPARWAEQSLMHLDMQTAAAQTEARMNLAAIYQQAMAALQPPSQVPPHPPRMRDSPGPGRVPGPSPSHRAQSVRGRPDKPIRAVPGKNFRDEHR